MQRHFSRIALAVLLCLIVLGCAPSPQNQKFYIAELPSSSETAGSLSASTTAANASPTSVQAKRVYADLREWMWLDRLFRTKPLRQLKSLNELEAVLVPEYPRLTGGLRKQQNTEQPDTALIPKNYNVAVITHCDIEVLKAFVDVGWWSLVCWSQIHGWSLAMTVPETSFWKIRGVGATQTERLSPILSAYGYSHPELNVCSSNWNISTNTR